MTRRIKSILASAFALFSLAACSPVQLDVPGGPGDGSWQQQASEIKLSNITYQVNVYSFADSDGDGWGDIRGITEHLDYLDKLGATAIQLSPVFDAMSYHGYDVTDHYNINSRLGTENDLNDLIYKAKAKDIAIYLDFSLNDSGKDNGWFVQAINDPGGKYCNYYVLSEKPGEFVTGEGGSWYSLSVGSHGYHGLLHFKLDASTASQPVLTVTQTTDAAQNGNTDTSVSWFIYDNNVIRMYKTEDNIYEITLDFDNDWGFLVKDDATQWEDHKWGAEEGNQVIEFGKPKPLVKGSAAKDITLGGSDLQYWSSFDASRPDFYYGPSAKASESPTFKDLANAADKWIRRGVAGLRLNSVIWIYQNNTTANVSFLKQWYERCNLTWRALGGNGDFYMVGEARCDNAELMAPYYEALPSNFNFYYWHTLRDSIRKGKGEDFAFTVYYFRNLFRGYRNTFIDAIKLSNHDEDRAADDLDRHNAKTKLAAAVLLTSPGKPFIYQGEELGYWGTKSRGDEFVRTPIKWNRSGAVPTAALNGKVDNTMLSSEISVEAQEENEASLLRVYRDFAKARNAWKALANGELETVTSPDRTVAMWKMSCDGQTVLVVHNFGSQPLEIPITGYSLDKLIVSNGKVSASQSTLSIDPYASAVYLQ